MANKIQRNVNKAIRNFSKQLRTDPYLQNRFYIRQLQAQREYDVWYYRFEIRDSISDEVKETHWYSEYDFYNGYIRYSLFNFFNDFIIKKLHKIGE
jgi:hypothetical protein